MKGTALSDFSHCSALNISIAKMTLRLSAHLTSFPLIPMSCVTSPPSFPLPPSVPPCSSRTLPSPPLGFSLEGVSYFICAPVRLKRSFRPNLPA